MIHVRPLPVILWGALCLAFCSPLWAEIPIPPLTARVIDHTGTLSAGQRLALENKLRSFESSKGSQIAVLIVPTTQPEAIEQYSMRVVEQWRLGRKDVDDGALLLVAKDDRKLRIEVGYGLEGALTDATSKRIISEVITPLFKAGGFHAGIAAGVDRMIRVIEGERLPAPEPSGGSPATVFALLMAFTVGSVILSVASVLLPRATARLGDAALNGGITGAIAWSLTKALGIALVVAALGFVVALVIGSLPTRRTGRWSSGNWRGGGFGGGGGGGGGFGGGGGGFGGGGASGSW